MANCTQKTNVRNQGLDEKSNISKKKTEKKYKAWGRAKEKREAIDIRKLVINNNQSVVGAFKKILLDPSTGPEAFDPLIVFETSKNAVPDFSRPESFSSTPKGLFGINARLSNSQKRKLFNKH